MHSQFRVLKCYGVRKMAGERGRKEWRDGWGNANGIASDRLQLWLRNYKSTWGDLSGNCSHWMISFVSLYGKLAEMLLKGFLLQTNRTGSLFSNYFFCYLVSTSSAALNSRSLDFAVVTFKIYIRETSSHSQESSAPFSDEKQQWRIGRHCCFI